MTRVNGRADPPRVPVVVQRCVSSMLNVLDLNLPKRRAFYTAPMASDNAQLDVLVVGMGFAGTTIARALADAGKRVHLVEKRDTHRRQCVRRARRRRACGSIGMARTCFTRMRIASSNSCLDSHSGFPMNSGSSQASTGSCCRSLINRTTVNKLYGLALDEAGVAAFLKHVRVPREPVVTSEDVVLSASVGDLCDKFFRGYTRKQWSLELSELFAGRCREDPRSRQR